LSDFLFRAWRWLPALFCIFIATPQALAAEAEAVPEPLLLASADLRRLTGSGSATPSPDSLLAKTLLEIRASRIDNALLDINQLISIRPDFKLAHLIRGDLLTAKAQPLATLGAAPASHGEKLSDLRHEARVRLMRYVDQPPSGSLPRQIIMMAPHQKYALLADAERARLYVFRNENGEPVLVEDFYMTIGRKGAEKRAEGDQKTPTGVYFISQRLPAAQLTDFYGAGAFPINYPNEWDRKQGNTGHGIWLHGVPSNTYSRPPRSSDGCVVVSNPDLIALSKYVQPGITPLIIATRTEWLERNVWLAQRKSILDQIDTWKTDWESLDADLYFGHYSSRFLVDAGQAWKESKRRNITQKEWIRVNMSDMSIYLYPAGGLAVISFTQNYKSNVFGDITHKRVYLQPERGQWRIALEENLPLPYNVARQ
jgi:murein L,D-transpeptidase YafK